MLNSEASSCDFEMQQKLDFSAAKKLKMNEKKKKAYDVSSLKGLQRANESDRGNDDAVDLTEHLL